MGSRALQEGAPENRLSLALPPGHGGHSKTRAVHKPVRVLFGTWSGGHPDLRRPASRTVRKDILLFKLLGLQNPVMAV